MPEVLNPKAKILNGAEDLPIIDGEIAESARGERLPAENKNREEGTEIEKKAQTTNGERQTQKSYVQYIFLPVVFLSVALLGGLRLDAKDASFLFLKPALICLVFASVLVFLFFRAFLLKLDGWFSESFAATKNAANAFVLLALFAASAQIFNSLLPERGLPFWTIGFCFFWTLWNNLFAEFDARRLVKSLAGMFALAFFVKYLILANLAAPPSNSLWQRVTENPAQEAFTYLLDLPAFAAATGYVQFFVLALYLLGLFLLKPDTDKL